MAILAKDLPQVGGTAEHVLPCFGSWLALYETVRKGVHASENRTGPLEFVQATKVCGGYCYHFTFSLDFIKSRAFEELYDNLPKDTDYRLIELSVRGTGDPKATASLLQRIYRLAHRRPFAS